MPCSDRMAAQKEMSHSDFYRRNAMDNVGLWGIHMSASRNGLEPDRPTGFKVFLIRLKGVSRLLWRGRIRHLISHLVNYWYRRRHPDYPWLSRSANSLVESLIKKSDVVLEFGSGGSTIWFAKRVSALHTVEHNPDWYHSVSRGLVRDGLRNVTCLLVEKDVTEERGQDAAYVRTTEKFASNCFDVVLVDGAYRDRCAMASLKLLKPGGLLIVDDCHWFLPSNSSSPNARTFAHGPASSTWQDFICAVSDWRCIWTSDGIHDTALYFKPCDK